MDMPLLRAREPLRKQRCLDGDGDDETGGSEEVGPFLENFKGVKK
jgi:hypothetical protein